MHRGLDIGADTGAPIVAARSGRVIFSGWKGGYGNTIDIDHGHGVVTRYAHQSATIASRGERVAQGALIGRVGMTGSATGPHLHFEVRVGGRPHDPRPVLRERRLTQEFQSAAEPRAE
jgi:murein DD-endopeptidase MepM/ murein hydrolase activator NlpD